MVEVLGIHYIKRSGYCIKSRSNGAWRDVGNSFDRLSIFNAAARLPVYQQKQNKVDLLQAYYGRNGECPMPVISASTPSDCFDAIYEAVRISVQHMTPVIFLSDGYIANGAEPWRFPKSADLPAIDVKFKTALDEGEEQLQPYKRDEKLVRPWAIPGTTGLEHRIGGLEKENVTGNVSYDPDNHQHMVKTRQEKVDKIADHIPLQKIDNGPKKEKCLCLDGVLLMALLKAAVAELLAEGQSVAHAHLRYMRPFLKTLVRY